MAQLILIGGLPGCGKSTLAAAIAACNPPAKVFSADDYRYKDGVYVFDPAETAEVHARCVADTFDAIASRRYSTVIVANTFTRKWERASYAISYGKPGWGDWDMLFIPLYDNGFTNEQLFARCVHNVPLDTIARMRANWEK